MTGALQDQHVVVVGGGSGIGLATAVAATAAGATVTVVTRSDEGIRRAEAAGARAVRGDVGDEPALAAVAAGLGPVDHVYVCAGSTRLGGVLDRAAVADQLAPLRVRLDGAVHVLRAFHPVLRDDGSVTVTGGVSSDRPVRGAWVSSVATAATEQLARAMALELAPLRFNAVAPGWTDTPMWDAVLGAEKDAVFVEATKGQLTGRLIRPEEIAAAVLFLMTAPSVTGEILHVDGGARLT